MTWQYGILEQLHTFGMRVSLPQFIEKFINMKVVVSLGNTKSQEKYIRESIPQRSVLSCA